MRRISGVIDWLEETLLAFLLAAMTLITFGQVVARYVFNSGVVWALELTIFLFAWLILIGASYGVRTRSHIGVDLLVRALPEVWRKGFGALALLLCLGYAAILFKGGWDIVALLHLIQIEAEDVPVPRWIPTMAVPLGAALLAVRLLQVAWALMRGRSDGLLIADEVGQTLDQVMDEAPDGNRQ